MSIRSATGRHGGMLVAEQAGLGVERSPARAAHR
jgi:hypothetical protein